MKRTQRTMTLSAVLGALTGGVAMFAVLMWLGSTKQAEVSGNASPTPSSSASPEAVPSSSPSASPAPRVSPPSGQRTIEHREGGFTFGLPSGYRVAEDIIALERTAFPQAASVTITRGSKPEEQAYVGLIEQLRKDQTATEAPAFLPGKTITLFVVTSDNSEASDAQLAHGREVFTTAHGLSATRYRRVEGLFTYDVTYLRVGEKTIAVQMTYGSEEPMFDEVAYSAVVASVTPLAARP